VTVASGSTSELRLWLGYVERAGALWEADGPDVYTVVLPPDLQRSLGLGEHLMVTASPEAAREDGSILLGPGHPLIDAAVSDVLGAGDAGEAWLNWPRPPLPTSDTLLAAARSFLPVVHGKVELGGPPKPLYAPLLRVGSLVTYTVDERFQECEEVWVCGRTGVAVGRVEPVAPAAVRRTADPVLDPDLPRALTGAESLMEARTARRLGELTAAAEPLVRTEVARTAAYYADALAALSKRRSAAPPDRQRLIDARIAATEAERDRRLQEIHDTFHARWTSRPFRLHLLHAPALEVPLLVRRGERRWPFTLTWLLHAAAFTAARCPTCAAEAILVAGRDRLGCRRCLGERPSRPVGIDLIGRRARPSPPVAPGRPHPELPGRTPAQHASSASVQGTAPPLRHRETLPQPDAAGKAGQQPLPPGVDPRPPRRRAGTARARPARESSGSDTWARQMGLTPSLQRQMARLRSEADRILRTRAKAGERLAYDLWQAAVERRPLPSRQVAPGSPFAVLQRLFGGAAPLVAIGAPHSAAPQSSSSESEWDPIREVGTTWGTVRVGGRDHAYVMSWGWDGERARALVLEVPGARPDVPLSLTSPAQVSRLHWNAPRPTGPMDAVEQALWDRDIAQFGLSQVVRCVAIWEGLRDRPVSPGRAGGAEVAPPSVTWGELSPNLSAASVAMAVSRVRRLRRTPAAVCRAYGVDLDRLSPLAEGLHRVLKRELAR
jgi:hypothetical protein